MPDGFNVVRAADGALVVRDVDKDTAISEKHRLNAEARVTNPETGRPTGMYLGQVVTYQVRTPEGLVI